MTKRMSINEREYLEKVYGGWLGKNIGGTLGEPMEGRMELLDLMFYPVLGEGPLPNDDLDLQLVWLHALEQYGARIDERQLGQAWLEHVFFPFDEYGYALTNLRRGLQAPVAGWFGNPFTNCMGSPIRSEIWAMVAPGAPTLAAQYAWKDAVVDHAGGEGVYGEMFFASIESAAFFMDDRDELIDLGLAMIPETSRIARAVRDLRVWHAEGKDWIEVRSLILEHHGHPNFTDAPQNVAFTILGWLYGEDFGDAILKAVNCGYDTDCTGATLGAILGIIGGRDSLPAKWVEPVGNRIAVSDPIKGFPFPKDLEELSARTLRVAREVLAAWDAPVAITEAATDASGVDLRDVVAPRELWDYKPWVETRALVPGARMEHAVTVEIDYGEEGPAVSAAVAKRVTFTLQNNTNELWEGTLELVVPAGWSCSGVQEFVLEAGGAVEFDADLCPDVVERAYYGCALQVMRYHDDAVWATYPVEFGLVAAYGFTVWGPGDEEGVEVVAATNRIPFEDAFESMRPGVYRVETTIVNRHARTVNVIAATALPVKAMLNGELIFEEPNETIFMPAYHRPPVGKAAEVHLPAGEHRLCLEIEVGARGGSEGSVDPFDLYVLLTGPKATKTPGSNYHYVDIMLVP